jgi:hypothetical protein
MRNQLADAPSEYQGTRFYIKELVKRIFAGTMAMTFLFLLIGGAVFLHLLSGKVSCLNERIYELTIQQEELIQENEMLVSEKIALATSVARKSHGLNVLGEELNNIEALVGLKPSPGKNLRERIDMAGQTALEKKMMLDAVPSGCPVDLHVVTSRYGMRVHPVHGDTSFHGGIDLRSPRGAPVYATADAIVEYAARHHASGLGKMIILVHNYGFATTYGHLDKIKVGPGDFVRKGDVIGLVGNTGVSTAPHLHYEIRYLKRRLDPEPFLHWSIETYDTVFEKEEHVNWLSIADAVRGNISTASTGYAAEIHIELASPLNGVRSRNRMFRQVQEKQ